MFHFCLFLEQQLFSCQQHKASDISSFVAAATYAAAAADNVSWQSLGVVKHCINTFKCISYSCVYVLQLANAAVVRYRSTRGSVFHQDFSLKSLKRLRLTKYKNFSAINTIDN